MMKYDKLPLSFDDQAKLLIERGMVGDLELISKRLESVSYFRLSGYWYPLRERNQDDGNQPLDLFEEGTTFEKVWLRYVFDRELRLLVMDAIERIEIFLRSQLAACHSDRHGLFSYGNDRSSMPNSTQDEWVRFLENIVREQGRSRDVFVKHFKEKYGSDEDLLPVWMATELWSFGTLAVFYQGSEFKIQREVSSRFDLQPKVFKNWVMCLNTVRNICAHHGRLWNREFGTGLVIPRDEAWSQFSETQLHTRDGVLIPVHRRIFSILTACKWSLDRIAPQSSWDQRLRSLLENHSEIPKLYMGFPEKWEELVIWKI